MLQSLWITIQFSFFRIVLWAFADNDYKVVIVEVGCQCKISDGDIYQNSEFYNALQNGKFNLSGPRSLPKTNDPFWGRCKFSSFVFVANDAFLLAVNSMKPYGGKFLSDFQRIFDHRLSRYQPENMPLEFGQRNFGFPQIEQTYLKKGLTSLSW